MADAGDIWFRALSGIGQNIGGGIAAIGQDYQERHKAYQQQAGIADALSKIGVTPSGDLAPVGTELIGEDGKSVKVKSLIDQSAYDNFMARNKANSAEAIGGLNALNRLYSQSLTHAMNPTYGVPVPGVGKVQLTGPQAAAYSASVQKANRPASARTTNPDLNFTHAVKAHETLLSQVDDSMYQNYGVHPVDILQSDRHVGFTFNKDTGKYTNTIEGKTPDAISINTGEGPKFFSKDQFEALKKPAQDWQKLQQNPPDRNDPRFQSQSAPSSGGGSDLVAQANQIKSAYQSGKLSREEAAAQIKALSIPGLQ